MTDTQPRSGGPSATNSTVTAKSSEPSRLKSEATIARGRLNGGMSWALANRAGHCLRSSNARLQRPKLKDTRPRVLVVMQLYLLEGHWMSDICGRAGVALVRQWN